MLVFKSDLISTFRKISLRGLVDVFLMYPITPVKSAAPLSGSIKDFSLLWKTKSSCALFVGLIFRYKTDLFRRKENCTVIGYRNINYKYHADITSGDKTFHSEKF